MANQTLTEIFWEELRKKYLESLQHGQRDWENEEPHLKKRIPAIDNFLGVRYRIEAPLGVGGVGVVLRVYDTKLDAARAVKFPRPAMGKDSLFAEVVAGEVSSLREAAHPNIIQIYDQGSADVDGFKVPYYVMECIADPQDGFKYFDGCPRKGARVLVDAIRQIVCGLDHLHEIGLVHLAGC